MSLYALGDRKIPLTHFFANIWNGTDNISAIFLYVNIKVNFGKGIVSGIK